MIWPGALMNFFPGQVIDRYRVLRRIGIGGMASVYLVRHNQLKTLHALKVLTVPRPSVIRRMVREGQLQGRLRHPNVVPVSDIVEVRGTLALVMEYVAGPSLDRMLTGTRLTLDEADLIARGVLSAVEAAHEAGIVHRDIKPSNVLLSTADPARLVPRITDFGLAKALETDGDKSTLSGATLGTPAYMAPEQIRDASLADHRADVWSLGALLFELVTGERAFKGPDVYSIFDDIVRGRVPDVRTVAPDLPEGMKQAIEGALVVDLDARTATVAALAAQWCEGRETPTDVWDAATLERAQGMVFDSDDLPPDDDSASITYHLGEQQQPAEVEAPPEAEPPEGSPRVALMLGLALVVGGISLTALTARDAPQPPAPRTEASEVDALGVHWLDESPQPSETTSGAPAGPHVHFWLDAEGRTERLEYRNGSGAPLSSDSDLRWGFQRRDVSTRVEVERDPQGRVLRLEHQSAYGRLEQVEDLEWLSEREVRRRVRSPRGGSMVGLAGAPVEHRTLDTTGRVIESRFETPTGQPFANDDSIWGFEIERTPDGFVQSRTWNDATGAPALDGFGVVKSVYERHPDTRAITALTRYGLGDVPVAGGLGCHRSVYDYQDGVVTAEHCEDAAGKRIVSSYNRGCASLELARSDSGATLSCLDPDGMPLNSKEGPARWQYTLDEHGYPTEVRTFDATGAAFEDDEGVHVRGSTFDALGSLLVDGPFFDAEGAPVLAGEHHAHFLTYESDRGAAQVIVRHDIDGEPRATDEKPWVIQRQSLDDWGAAVRLAYFDGASRPVLIGGGYHEIHFLRDELGQVIRRELRGLTGELVAGMGPMAVFETQMDAYGHEVGRSYLGADGKPVEIRGVASWRHTYNDRGHQLRTEAFDAEGNPTEDNEGVATYEAGYDPLGLLVEQRYYDAAGEPTVSPVRGHHRRQIRHDHQGRPIEQRYFGLDGAPVPQGCAVYRRELDELGGAEESCVDAEGNPTDLPTWF